jgi:hypothetical protein
VQSLCIGCIDIAGGTAEINYIIAVIDSIKIVYSTAPFNMYQNYYYAGNTSPRYFNITKLDTLNKIISGVFAFTLYGQNGLGGTDSVVITDGRFDFTIGSYSRCSN